jgi:hypothetical protein
VNNENRVNFRDEAASSALSYCHSAECRVAWCLWQVVMQLMVKMRQQRTTQSEWDQRHRVTFVTLRPRRRAKVPAAPQERGDVMLMAGSRAATVGIGTAKDSCDC